MPKREPLFAAPTAPPAPEASQEQKELLTSAVKFTEYLTTRWPQTEMDGGVKKINYHLSGSLAFMLLAHADSFTDLDERQMPTIKERQTHAVPAAAKKILSTFVRPISDLDFVESDFYKGKLSVLQNSFVRLGSMEYKRQRSEMLLKGAGGPTFDDIPKAGKKILAQKEGQLYVMCDPVESYGAMRTAKITIADRDYYIGRPDTVFAYKILHLLESYQFNPEKFNADFGKLLAALNEVYPDEKLMNSARQILTDYEDASAAIHVRLYEDQLGEHPYEKKVPIFIRKVLKNPAVSPEIRAVLERV